VTVTNTTNSVGAPADEPVHTVTTAGNQMLISANLVQCNHAGGDRAQAPEDPVPTISSHHAFGIAAANLIQYHTEKGSDGPPRAAAPTEPIQTVDASNRHGLISAQLTEYYGNGNPLDAREPMHTVTAHDREALLGVHLDKYFAGGYKMPGNSPEDPLTTVTVEPRHGLYAAHVVEFKGNDIGQRVDRPLRTITASWGEFAVAGTMIRKYEPGADVGHWWSVRALLNKHCGYTLADDEILLLQINGAFWYISDITMRMLTPRELYAAMGFPPDYIIDRDYTGKPYPKNQQVARCGNAVCPPMAAAVVRANLPEWCNNTITTMAELERVVAV